jgi:hypothetical protein
MEMLAWKIPRGVLVEMEQRRMKTRALVMTKVEKEGMEKRAVIAARVRKVTLMEKKKTQEKVKIQ